MSFDPDSYLSKKTQTRAPSQSLTDLPYDPNVNEGFNPDAYLSRFDQPKPASFSDKMQTQLESLGNAISLGYLPQIQALAEKIMPDPSGGVDAKLREQGFEIPNQGYVEMRDENIKRQQSQAERNPLDSVIGSVAGSLVTAPIISAGAGLLKAGQAVGGLARLKDSARLGATLGLLSNPGDEEGVISPIQATSRLKNTASGGAIGAAGQAAGEGVSKIGNAIKNAPQAFDKLSKIKAFKATGAMLKDFRQAHGANAPEEIGETLLKKNLVNAGDTFEDIASKTAIARKETGQNIRDIYKRVGDFIKDSSGKTFSKKEQKLLDITRLDGEKLAESALGKLSQGFKNNLDNSDAKKRVLDVLENLKGMGPDIDLQDLIDARVNLDDSINYSKKIGDLPIVQQQLKTVRDTLHKAIQNRVRVVGKVVKDGELINQLKSANRDYGHLATVERIAKDKIARESANRFFSLGDRITGSAGGIIGAATGDSPEERVMHGLLGLVGGAAAGKVGRYSLPVVSRSAQKLGNALKLPANFAKYGEPLIEAAKRSPDEFQALLNQFGKEPEFKMLYQK